MVHTAFEYFQQLKEFLANRGILPEEFAGLL
jgi:hypothetical protein